MKTQHTPTPWMVFEKAYFRSICTVGSVGSRKRIVKDISKENAEFIARAVNSHEALLEACKAVVVAIRLDGPKHIAWLNLATDIEKLIKQAEGSK